MTGEERRLLDRANKQLDELRTTVQRLTLLLQLDDGPPLPVSSARLTGRWTEREDTLLRDLIARGVTHEKCAETLGRTVLAVTKRVSRLRLAEEASR